MISLTRHVRTRFIPIFFCGLALILPSQQVWSQDRGTSRAPDDWHEPLNAPVFRQLSDDNLTFFVQDRLEDPASERQPPDSPDLDPNPEEDLIPPGLPPLEEFADEPVIVVPALSQEVTTVTRQESTVGRSPAAVFVVTQDMIRRSGARSLPEVLRLVPGLFVARVDGNKWVITSRGFGSVGGRFGNKLLVQIDGRTVYSPLFAGVFWDVQDVLLEDIERIEVIRGPGATVWGANAVNGIINILTKSARDTHGVYAHGGGGTEEKGFAAGRIGGVTEGGVHWRVYGKGFERDQQFEPTGREFDDWRQGRAGFRMDWSPTCCDQMLFQGDIYTGVNGTAGQHGFAGDYALDEPVAGGNLLTRWTRSIDDEREWSLQMYYDRTDRRTLFFDQNINIFDTDFQYRFPLNPRNRVIWGLGYRRAWDHLPTTVTPAPISTSPVARSTDLVSAFIQDEIVLSEDELYFTIGTKMEDNFYSDFEIQPTARLLWLPDERSAAWLSYSRAVRTPSRLEHEGRFITDVTGPPVPGVPISLIGIEAVDGENLNAYELGYRRQPAEWFSWDVAVFYNTYDDLVTSELVSLTPPTSIIFSGERAQSYGGELFANLDVTPTWHLFGWYSFIRVLGVADPTPTHQAFVMSSWDVGCDVDLDVLARYVDEVPNVLTASGIIPHYISLDVRVAYRPTDQLEVSLVGQNLLDPQHPEFGSNVFTGDLVTEVQRGVYGMVRWQY